MRIFRQICQENCILKITSFLLCCGLLLIPASDAAARTINAKPLVLVAADSAPTAYIVNGTQKGILVDVINEAFKRTNYDVEIVLMPWARCLEEVRKGTVDGIFSVYDLPERQGFLTYSKEILIIQVQAFFVLKSSTIHYDGDFKKMSNLKIGVINKTSYGTLLDLALTDGTFRKVDIANNAESNVKKLLVGRVDVIPSYRHVALSTAKQIGAVDKIRELNPSIEAVPSYLAFTKERDFSRVIFEFDKALASMKKDGNYDKIFNKYLK
jgi:polar amino acid transport system substrate-binding protein